MNRKQIHLESRNDTRHRISNSAHQSHSPPQIQQTRPFQRLQQPLGSAEASAFEIHELINKMASSKLQDSSYTVDMSPTAPVNQEEEPSLWQPFPDPSREAYSGPSVRHGTLYVKKNGEHRSFPQPPTIFATPELPAVEPLLVLDPLNPQLVPLDAAWKKEKQKLMSEHVEKLDKDEDAIDGHSALLGDYYSARLPHVQCLGKRLQAVMCARNERVIDLPNMGSRILSKHVVAEYPEFGYGPVHPYSEDELNHQAKELMAVRKAEIEAAEAAVQEELNHKVNVASVAAVEKELKSQIVVTTEAAVEQELKSQVIVTAKAVDKPEPKTPENKHQSDERRVNVVAAPSNAQKLPTPPERGLEIPPPKNAIEALFRDNYRNKIVAERQCFSSHIHPISRPRSPLDPIVNKLTGSGLREYMTLKAQEGLIRKRDCSSITFSDFMPNKVHGNSNYHMFGHWTANREKGERIEVYELELPASYINHQTGEESTGLQNWIWVLISRPVLTLSATDQSTQLQTEQQKPAYRSGSAAVPLKPAPTFPSPIPTSWVSFACPLDSVTEFHESVDKISTFTPHGYFLPTHKTLEKRQDFDFSHAGIPIFEFSSTELISSMYPKGHAPAGGTQFLSVESLGGYDKYDYCGHLSAHVLRKNLQKRMKPGEKRDTNEYGEDRGAPFGLEAPKSGIWWEEFFKRVDLDAAVWEDIRSAMGRGKCRVSIKWSEIESVLGQVFDPERFEVRPESTGSPPAKPQQPTPNKTAPNKKTLNKKTPNKATPNKVTSNKTKKSPGKRTSDEVSGNGRPAKAAKTAISRKRSKLATEVMTTSPQQDDDETANDAGDAVKDGNAKASRVAGSESVKERNNSSEGINSRLRKR